MHSHFDKAPELSQYDESELLNMVATILAEPGELTALGNDCLSAINSEFIVRANRKPEKEN
jgi:hypothetical protein